MKNLGLILEARGVTIYRLAQLSGCGTATLYDLLHGRTKRPEYQTVKRLAEVLEVAPDDFFLDSFNAESLERLNVKNSALEQKEPTP